MASEVQLLEQWRAGDNRAGSALFERHFSALFRFFRSKTTGHVEDLVQETFLACVRGRDRIQNSEEIRGYLFGAARNVLYRHFHARAHVEAPLDFGVTSMHDLAPSPSGVVAAREEQQLLLEALRRLPVDLQIAVELYYFEDLTGPELAVALGVPEGTARSRIRRATEQLHVVMKDLTRSPTLLRSTLDNLDDIAHSVRDLLTTKVGSHS